MNKGDYIFTPRFCNVRIEEVFENREQARENGYTEPTHYRGDYGILGKSTGVNRMVFAAVIPERYVIGQDFNTKEWWVYDNETDRNLCRCDTKEECFEYISNLSK